MKGLLGFDLGIGTFAKDMTVQIPPHVSRSKTASTDRTLPDSYYEVIIKIEVVAQFA